MSLMLWFIWNRGILISDCKILNKQDILTVNDQQQEKISRNENRGIETLFSRTRGEIREPNP
jgi:hypothetical protein